MDEHERRSPSEYPDRYSSIFDLVAADFSDGSQMMIDYIKAYSLSDWAA